AFFPFGFESSKQSDPPVPTAPGKFFEVAGHKMHLHCAGQGSPTVVVEVGVGDISTDWVLVQDSVSKFSRICTYDRSGYAWREPGRLPATYPQMNLELHELLATAKEKGPFVLVGHSFGGPLVRSYTRIYPDEVAGLLLVDTVHEDQRIPIMGKAVLLRGDAKGRPIPAPRLAIEPETAIRPTNNRTPRTTNGETAARQPENRPMGRGAAGYSHNGAERARMVAGIARAHGSIQVRKARSARGPCLF